MCDSSDDTVRLLVFVLTSQKTEVNFYILYVLVSGDSKGKKIVPTQSHI